MPSVKKRQPGFFGFIFESEVSFFIIVANTAVFFFIHYTYTGLEISDKLILYPGNILKGNYLCLITSGFIHRDAMHLFLNILGIFVFGRIVERHLGSGKTIFIYFGSLFISMLFSIVVYTTVLKQNIAIIGASGALMGLISAAMLLDPFCITFEMILPIPVMAKAWLFFYADIKGLLRAESDGISHLAHIFGFLSVALLVYFLPTIDKKKMKKGLAVNMLSLVVFIIVRHWMARF